MSLSPVVHVVCRSEFWLNVTVTLWFCIEVVLWRQTTDTSYKRLDLNGRPKTLNKKPSCHYDSRPYRLSVTFKVIQGRWFLSHLKGCMRFPISDQWQPLPYLAPFSHNRAYWPSRSSKINDFYLICQGVCQFLLVINSNLFRDMASFPLKSAHFSASFNQTQIWKCSLCSRSL